MRDVNQLWQIPENCDGGKRREMGRERDSRMGRYVLGNKYSSVY